MTWMTAGPAMIKNKTGRKKVIIGTVSFGGRAAAFFSAAAMRASRLSLDKTRRPTATGVPYFSDCWSVVLSDLKAGNPVRSAKFSKA